MSSKFEVDGEDVPVFRRSVAGKGMDIADILRGQVVKARARNDSKQDTMFTAYVNNC